MSTATPSPRESRYWFTVDAKTMGHSWDCGWCFGTSEHDARERARARLRMRFGSSADTATIWLQWDAYVGGVSVTADAAIGGAA